MSTVDVTAAVAPSRPERYNASCIVDRHVDAGRAGKAAFVASDATLTYGELRAQVNRAGHVLRSLGVGREQRVLLVLDDTTAFPTLFLGAMRIGAVPVPISPLDRDENFRHYVEDSYAQVVCTDAGSLERLRGVLSGLDVRFVVRGATGDDVAELDAGLAAEDDELTPADKHRDDMAFWLYSSGRPASRRAWCTCTTTSRSRARTSPGRSSGSPPTT